MYYKNILIITGGKTGSSTLLKSFKHHFSNEIVFKSFNCIYDDDTKSISIPNIVSNASKLLIVNSYREPVSRMISSIFQHLHLHIPDPQFNQYTLLEQYRIVSSFLDNLLNQNKYIDDYHPNYLIGNDQPFDLPFISSFLFKGTPKMDYLFLRHDQIQLWESQIGTLFPSFRIIKDNVSSNKYYHRLYQYTMQHYRHPNFEQLIDTQYFMLKHYYTENEIMTLKKKWCSVQN